MFNMFKTLRVKQKSIPCRHICHIHAKQYSSQIKCRCKNASAWKCLHLCKILQNPYFCEYWVMQTWNCLPYLSLIHLCSIYAKCCKTIGLFVWYNLWIFWVSYAKLCKVVHYLLITIFIYARCCKTVGQLSYAKLYKIVQISHLCMILLMNLLWIFSYAKLCKVVTTSCSQYSFVTKYCKTVGQLSFAKQQVTSTIAWPLPTPLWT